MRSSYALASLACLALLPLGASAIAFTGAVGYGANTNGGNSGTKVYVTNLNDSGAGSFRDAVSASNRYISFNVSGYVKLSSAVTLSSGITIDGTTAPGKGIGFMGAEISASKHSNIIIRNIRMRQGDLDSDTGKSAFNMGEGSNIILDHVSVEYGQWDSIDAVKAVNITISNSIIALPIGQQFGAHVEGGPATFYRNLWVSAHNRQPLSKANAQYVNNVVYNYQAAYTAANTGGVFSHDIINNYFITGPSTTSSKNNYYQMNDNQSAYATGNFLDSNNDGVLNGAASNTVGSAKVLTSPWDGTSQGLATLSAADAVTWVLANGGATPHDEVDNYVINLVKSYGKSGALISHQSSTGLSNGGYGTLS